MPAQQLDLETGEYPESIASQLKGESEFNNQQVSDFVPDYPLVQIRTSTNGDIIYLGNQAFKRTELENAFAGSLNPGLHKVPARPMGNPVPLGLAGFCICCFVVSMAHVQARDLKNQNMMAGAALVLGGILESIAGLWCLMLENTFAATALGAFGGFWMSYAFVLGDVWGIVSSYETTEEFGNAMGFFLTAWVIFAFLMWLCTFKATWPFFILFLFVWVFLMCLAIGNFTGELAAIKAAGVLGLVATFVGFFIVFAAVVNNENSYISVPDTPMPHAPTV